MWIFKDDVVNKLTQEERFDLITEGLLREPVYDFGTELVINDDDPNQNIKYECEYLTDKCSLQNSRMLWCWSLESNVFVKLPEDPLFDQETDEEYETESYLKLKEEVANGNYPTDLSTLKSPAEFRLVLPKLIEGGLVTFNKETGEYNFSEEIQQAISEKEQDGA